MKQRKPNPAARIKASKAARKVARTAHFWDRVLFGQKIVFGVIALVAVCLFLRSCREQPNLPEGGAVVYTEMGADSCYNFQAHVGPLVLYRNDCLSDFTRTPKYELFVRDFTALPQGWTMAEHIKSESFMVEVIDSSEDGTSYLMRIVGNEADGVDALTNYLANSYHDPARYYKQ